MEQSTSSIEPILSDDQREYAEEILDDIRSGEMTYDEGVQEVMEVEVLNKDGVILATESANKTRTKIINYIKWRMDSIGSITTNGTSTHQLEANLQKVPTVAVRRIRVSEKIWSDWGLYLWIGGVGLLILSLVIPPPAFKNGIGWLLLPYFVGSFIYAYVWALDHKKYKEYAYLISCGIFCMPFATIIITMEKHLLEEKTERPLKPNPLTKYSKMTINMKIITKIIMVKELHYAVVKCGMILLLFYAMNDDHEYGFYTLLRWLMFAGCGYICFSAFMDKNRFTTFAFGFISIIFNPLKEVHFHYETWKEIDLWVAICLIVFAFADVWFIFRKHAHLPRGQSS